jgi:CheY-like chemotaxis protein
MNNTHRKLHLVGKIGTNFSPDQLVLIVDHYRVGQRVALLQLQYFGLTAHVVTSCRQAIKAIKNHHYALVLIGWGMPNCNGKACTKCVRKEQLRRNTHTTVVAVTAHAWAGDKERCLASGMDDLLSKPITIGDMQQMLSRHLEVA